MQQRNENKDVGGRSDREKLRGKEKDKLREKEEKAGTDLLGRRIWDKEFYYKRAAERSRRLLLEGEDDGNACKIRNLGVGGDELDDDYYYYGTYGYGEGELSALLEEGKKKGKEQYPPVGERRPLEGRSFDVDLEKEVGRFRVVTQHTPKMLQGGYYCDVCDCLIKDSQAYLDHINGKKHNRMLGMTMRVEKVSVERVKHRIKDIKKAQIAAKNSERDPDEAIDRGAADRIAARIRQAEERDRAHKKVKKRHKHEKKRQKAKHNHHIASRVGNNEGNVHIISDAEIVSANLIKQHSTIRSNSGSRNSNRSRSRSLSRNLDLESRQRGQYLSNSAQSYTYSQSSAMSNQSQAFLQDDEEVRMLVALGLPTQFSGI